MASSTPSLSKTSNPPLSSSSRLIPHQPQFMQTETTSQRHQQQQQYQHRNEKKLVKIQNTQKLIEENLMPINFSSTSPSSTNSSELEMKLQQRSCRRKSSRILRGLTTALMSYPVLESQPLLEPPTPTTPPAPIPNAITNSNYHLKWDDHFNSTVAAIQCLLASETFVDVTLVCDEDEDEHEHDTYEKNIEINGNYSTLYNSQRFCNDRRRLYRRKNDMDDDDVLDSFADDEDNEMLNLKSTYQIKLKAHKVILSTCSEYFRKIFSENSCKHPVIVLKDFQQWEVRSLLDFMYKGQVIVKPERLETLIKSADALQIRGLRECIEKSEEWVRLKTMPMRERMGDDGGGEGSENDGESFVETKARVLNRSSDNTKLIPCSNNTSHHRQSQVDNESGPSSPKLLNLSMSGGGGGDGMSPQHRQHLTSHISPYEESNGPQTSIVHQTTVVSAIAGATHHHHHNQINPTAPSPPFPRRKQARPRRRSGDFVAQDLRISVTPPLLPILPPGISQDFAAMHDFHIHNNNNKIHDFTIGSKGAFDLHPPHLNHMISAHFLKNWSHCGIGSPIGTPPQPHNSSPINHELDTDDETSSPPDRFRSPPGTPDSSSPLFDSKQFTGDGIPLFNDPILGMTFKASPPSPSFFLNLNNGHPLLSGHHSDSESNNPESASTPPSIFSPAGFSHHGGGSGANHNSSSHLPQPWPGLPLGPAPIFGRHRAQHSAPRGGPPRAWSNADLTEALHNVWNKKMTTSQASRIFGIPYNSLLMYVRGKYGKSLKLDLLKKGLDLALENSNNAANALNNSNANSTPVNIGSTLISNNNNNNTPPISQKSKSHSHSYSNSEDSPPSGLALTHSHSHIGNNSNCSGGGGSGSGGGGDRTDPQDIIPSGFNPFSAVSSIFGDYPPPFPFPPSLSHIIPPVNHLSVDKVNSAASVVALTRRNDGDK